MWKPELSPEGRAFEAEKTASAKLPKPDSQLSLHWDGSRKDKRDFAHD